MENTDTDATHTYNIKGGLCFAPGDFFLFFPAIGPADLPSPTFQHLPKREKIDFFSTEITHGASASLRTSNDSIIIDTMAPINA